jgi:hypothetical protein
MSVLSQSPLELHGFKPPLVVVPLDRWSKIAKRALTFALTISPDVTALHIDSGERTTYLQKEWCGFVEQPVQQLGMAPPKLVILPSPYRFVITPIVDYVLDLAQKNPDPPDRRDHSGDRGAALVLPHAAQPARDRLEIDAVFQGERAHPGGQCAVVRRGALALALLPWGGQSWAEPPF